MNEEIKAKWLTALRSGEYEQGDSVLRSKSNRYCCLGVLCEIVGEEWGPVIDRGHQSGYTIAYVTEEGRHRDEINYAPPYVLDTAGLDEEFAFDLAALNDRGFSFQQISQWIEEGVVDEVHGMVEDGILPSDLL